MSHAIKRKISILLVLLLVFSSLPISAEGDKALLTFDSVSSAKTGDTVSISMHLDDLPSQVYMIQFAVEYDSDKLSVISASGGSIFTSVGGPTINANNSGIIYFNWDSVSAAITKDCVLLDMSFLVTTEEAGTAEIKVSAEEDIILANWDGEVPFNTQSGSVQITTAPQASEVPGPSATPSPSSVPKPTGTVKPSATPSGTPQTVPDKARLVIGGSGEGNVGTDMPVSVSLEDLPDDVYMIQFALKYDPDCMECISADSGSVFERCGEALINSSVPGYVYFNWDTISTPIVEKSDLLLLTFRLLKQGSVFITFSEGDDLILGSMEEAYEIDIEHLPVSITPVEKVTITLDQDELVLRKGDQVTLLAEASDPSLNEQIVWECENESGTGATECISVSQNGTVTARSAGTAYVVAYVMVNGEKISVRCRIEVQAETIIDSGTCGDNLTWALTDDGTLTISGTGAMTNWGAPSGMPWYHEKEKINALAISSGVTSIGSKAFYGCTGLTSVTIPANITSVGRGAFGCCTDLSSITVSAENAVYYSSGNCIIRKDNNELVQGCSTSIIPDNITRIGNDAFVGCKGLISLVLPETVTSIGEEAFFACTELTSVVIPDGVTSIDGYSFQYCNSLTSVTIPASVTNLGAYSFYSCISLTEVIFEGEPPTWGGYMFTGCPSDFTIRYPASLAASWAPNGETTWKGYPIEPYEEKRTEEKPDTKAGLTLSASYLLMTVGESAEVQAFTVPEEAAGSVVWSTEENDGVISVEGGTVQALRSARPGKPGVAYVKATLTWAGEVYVARCRVDVVEEDVPVASKVTGVQLVTTSVTSKIYSEAYARVSFLPLLEQNLNPLSEGENDIENTGLAIDSAVFATPAIAQYFDLQVIDDRTLAVVPTQMLIETGLAGKKLSSYYTSRVVFTIGGQEFTSSASLKVTVNKAKPAVKAKAITLNKYAAVLGDPYAITFTGGTVTEITNVTGVPAWLNVDTENRTLALSTETIPAKYASGTVKFTCTVEGWKAPVTVSQKYSVKSTAPSLKFGTKSVTLLQGSPDATSVKLTVTPAVYTDAERFPITFVQLTKLVGRKYVPIENETELYVTCEDGLLKLSAPEKAPDGKAHTYKVTLSVAGKNFTYTVKTTAPVAPTLTLTAGGTINTKVENSPATIKVKPKNFHAGIGESYSLIKVQQYKRSRLVTDDVTGLFDITEAGNVFTFTEKALGTLESGYTYKAVIGVDIDGDGSTDGKTSAALKIAFARKTPAISASVKSAGSLDITRPGKTMTLTGSVKNWFGDVTWSIKYYQKVGRKTNEVAYEDTPFAVTQDGNVFTVTVKPGTAATSAYSVKLVATVDGKDYLTASKALPVKKGKVTVKQSVKSGVLYKKDRYSEIVIDLSIADTTVAPVARVALDAASSEKFDLTDLGSGRYALGYLNDTLPMTFKASTAKLLVYLEGMPETVSAATVSLKVSYK